MEEIAKQLRDPSWWFTAFFIAIFASVIAGFLKDRIEKWIGGLSSNLRVWRDKRQVNREAVIEALLANETYFHIALFRVLVALILFAISIILYSTGPVLISMAPESEQMSDHVEKGFVAWKIMMPVLGLFTSYIGFRATTRLSIVFEAIRRYRNKHALPKLP